MMSLLVKAQKRAAENMLSNCHPLLRVGVDEEVVEPYFTGLILTRKMAVGGSAQLDGPLRRRQCALGVSDLSAGYIVKRLSVNRQGELIGVFEGVILQLCQLDLGFLFLEETTCLWQEWGGGKKDLLEFRSSLVRRMGFHSDVLDVLATIDVALEKRDAVYLRAVKELIPNEFEYLFVCHGTNDAAKIVDAYVVSERKRKDSESLRIKNKPEHRRMVTAYLDKIFDDYAGFGVKETLFPSAVAEIEKWAEPIDCVNVDWQIIFAKIFHGISDYDVEKSRKCLWQLLFLLAVKFKKIDDEVHEDLTKLLVAVNRGDCEKKFRAVCRRYLKKELDLIARNQFG